jgi:hypothetical protein
MPEEQDEFDEPDLRQQVVDVDVANELSHLGGTVEAISDKLDNVEQKLGEIDRAEGDRRHAFV